VIKKKARGRQFFSLLIFGVFFSLSLLRFFLFALPFGYFSLLDFILVLFF